MAKNSNDVAAFAALAAIHRPKSAQVVEIREAIKREAARQLATVRSPGQRAFGIRGFRLAAISTAHHRSSTQSAGVSVGFTLDKSRPPHVSSSNPLHVVRFGRDAHLQPVQPLVQQDLAR